MRGRLQIDLGALARNFQILKDTSRPGCGVAPAVKASAYGLGIEPVARRLIKEGAGVFFVASLDEALELRGIVGSGPVIYTLNGFEAERAALYKTEQISAVLNSGEALADFAMYGQQSPAPALHIDTGMNRLGVRVDALDNLDEQNFSLVMSHFACADEADNPMNDAQFVAFTKAAQRFENVPKCLANSSGIFRSANYHFDMVRPGMALYGLNPRPESDNPMAAVVNLSVPVLQVWDAKAGETCGYNATYRFDKNTKLCVVGLGYADGFLRSLSNNGALFWNGVACPIRGRVSMDLTIIDLSDIPENDLPRAGDMVEVIGPHQSADDLAASAGTIGYEILTALGPRYERVYTD
ncbi:MAG: alanine racemase [Rhodospirillales bacterium]|nr:alanine racemase [Rhodospirillales bacterium]